jgi:hypothetical protein
LRAVSDTQFDGHLALLDDRLEKARVATMQMAGEEALRKSIEAEKATTALQRLPGRV